MKNLIPALKEACANASSVILCVDENVFAQWRDEIETAQAALGPDTHLHPVVAGESNKSLEQASSFWGDLVRLGCDRHSVLVAIGGGVTCDLIGFVASTYMRGISCVMIPTTLLAMVDAAIGGKNGINLPEGKNLVGSMLQPTAVLTDSCWLQSLPERELRSGIAEVVKYGLIADIALLDQLDSEPIDWPLLVKRCQEIKQHIVDADPQDREGVRRVLNFGHSFAHAFEAITSYEQLRHGEAVAVGMLCAMELSKELGHVSDDEVLHLERLLTQLGLPTRLDGIDVDAVMLIMLRDKKVVAGCLRLILARGWGEVFFADNVDMNLLRAVLERRCSKVPA